MHKFNTILADFQRINRVIYILSSSPSPRFLQNSFSKESFQLLWYSAADLNRRGGQNSLPASNRVFCFELLSPFFSPFPIPTCPSTRGYVRYFQWWAPHLSAGRSQSKISTQLWKPAWVQPSEWRGRGRESQTHQRTNTKASNANFFLFHSSDFHLLSTIASEIA